MHAIGCPLSQTLMGNPSGHSLIWYGGWAFPAEMALRSASILDWMFQVLKDPDIHYTKQV